MDHAAAGFEVPHPHRHGGPPGRRHETSTAVAEGDGDALVVREGALKVCAWRTAIEWKEAHVASLRSRRTQGASPVDQAAGARPPRSPISHFPYLQPAAADNGQTPTLRRH